jgi:hypothetical protein
MPDRNRGGADPVAAGRRGARLCRGQLARAVRNRHPPSTVCRLPVTHTAGGAVRADTSPDRVPTTPTIGTRACYSGPGLWRKGPRRREAAASFHVRPPLPAKHGAGLRRQVGPDGRQQHAPSGRASMARRRARLDGRSMPAWRRRFLTASRGRCRAVRPASDGADPPGWHPVNRPLGAQSSGAQR